MAKKNKEILKEEIIDGCYEYKLSLALMENIEVLIADEAHGAKSEVYDTLLSNAINCKWRIGLTGTLPRNYADKMSIQAALGRSKVYITPQGLVERGLATPVFITTLFMNYSQEDRKVVKALKTYQDEVKFINQHEGRNEKVAQIASKLSEKGNTLLLFDNIAHGKRLLERLIVNKYNIPGARLLDKFTPKYIKEVYEDDATLFFNGEITEVEIKKFKKVLNDNNWEYDASKLKSLADYDIYFIYGGVDADQREYIRNVINVSGVDMMKLLFGDKRIDIEKQTLVPLNDGTSKKAEFITEDDDVCDKWISEY